MGMVLGGPLFIGAIIGSAISIGLCILAVILVKKASTRRMHVWRVFASAALVLLPTLLCAVYFFPYDTGSPGNNYGILFKYYLFMGFAYAAIPGITAILSFLATVFCRACTVKPEYKPDTVSAFRPIHVLLPLLCLVSGLWLGAKFIVPGDTGLRKAVPGDSHIEASRMFKTADAFFKQGRYDESLHRYTELIESGKLGIEKLGKAYETRGWCHIRIGNYGAAVADFDRELRLTPKSAAAYNGRGWANMKLEKYDAALGDFNSASALSPRYAMVLNNHGVLLKNMGRRDQAKENYLRAIELDNDPEAKAYALLNLAWIEYQEGRTESAFSFTNNAVEILPDYAMGYNNRGAIREDMGQHEEAMADYAKAIDLNNDSEASAHALLNRGVHHLMNDDFTSAERDFETVLRESLPMKEYAAVWLFICMKKRGANSAEIDERLSGIVEETDMTEWPSSAMRLFRGDMQVDEFSASYWHDRPVERLFRKAEMFYYMGQYRLYQERADEATDYFGQSLNLGVRDSNATRMAKFLLKALGSQPENERETHP